jgi:redox-sensitive bicupin YhaK (pirin superfamily)
MSIRPVHRLAKAKPALEGAGVHLRRAFGFGDPSKFDPFLLLDDFRNDVPEDYLAGFPWHPHRGIETITYVLAGTVEHADSLGNRGAIGAGDVQWMTAGRGIIHQEKPKGDPVGRMHGFQLWANLPSALKMTAPRYQEVKGPEIPEMTDDDGSSTAATRSPSRPAAKGSASSSSRASPSASPWPVRTDRDEHPGAAAGGVSGASGGDVPEGVIWHAVSPAASSDMRRSSSSPSSAKAGFVAAC